MSGRDYRNYFNTFKVSGLVKETPDGEAFEGQKGNLAEYSLDDLKTGTTFTDTEEGFVPTNIKQVFYSDGSDMLANRGFAVSFMHVPSSKYVHFKAFINALNETYSSDWSSEPVYGRTDPIKNFKQTTRSITLSLIVPASSEGEGFENLAKVQQLLSFLYPSYEQADNALTISQSPLVRMKVMNLIRKTKYFQDIGDTFGNDYGPGHFESHKRPAANLGQHSAINGLLGVIRNVSINHNLENTEMGAFILADGVVIPKAIEVTLDFDVLHERVLGWQENQFTDRLFPYGLDLENSSPMSEAKMQVKMEDAARAAVTAQINKLQAEEVERNHEQLVKNAIAAGHLVASGVVNGKIQYELTGKGRRAHQKALNKLSEGADVFADTKKGRRKEAAQMEERAAYSETLTTLDEFIK